MNLGSICSREVVIAAIDDLIDWQAGEPDGISRLIKRQLRARSQGAPGVRT
ncbi:MAG: hypothetical protein KGL36_12840 [Gammaproteobacteria bacterium]|nr:hypothetical protein [Gammaproteobacteria bacterium]